MKKGTCLLLLITIISCTKTLSDEEIKSQVWKCGKPCGLGDVIVFHENVKLIQDTIFLNEKPYAKIVKRSFDLDEDTKIQMINLQGNSVKDTCIFHAK